MEKNVLFSEIFTLFYSIWLPNLQPFFNLHLNDLLSKQFSVDLFSE